MEGEFEMKKTIAIIGGSQKQTFEQIAKKKGVSVLFHDGKAKTKLEKVFFPIVNKADCVMIMQGALNHNAMGVVRELCDKIGKPIGFHQGRGASGAIDKGLELVG